MKTAYGKEITKFLKKTAIIKEKKKERKYENRTTTQPFYSFLQQFSFWYFNMSSIPYFLKLYK